MKQSSILPFVTKPGRYLGQEYNIAQKPWDDVDLRCVLIFPDLYEIGMSHQGLQILYHILNARKDILADRAYCPDSDVENRFREKNLYLTSLESDRPLKDFDIIGITLPYELCYTNILTILDLANIPFYAKDRDESYPLVLGGGSCSLNPEPVADFFDAVLLGDGEEAILEIAEVAKTSQKEKWKKKTLLTKLSKLRGVYIPSFYRPEYDHTGRIQKIQHLNHAPPQIQRRILADLNSVDHLLRPIVPNTRIVHDRLGIEVARGCTRGCRFCQAGMTYRPVRERTPKQVLHLAQHGIDNSGFDELALLSLSTGDYSCLEELLPKLMDNCAPDYISVSMPSMRVGTLSPSVMDQIKRVRKTGFTVAPEAGSERLRRVINKGITEEDLLTTCRDAFSLGWTLIKLYFMIGLPTETEEDLNAIAELAQKTKKEGDKSGQKRRQINVSLGTFVPKPHTPFQWERQLSLEESRDRIFHLKKIMPRKGCKLKWHDPKQSFLEGVFSRGDRRLSALLVAAWKKGARLDGWSEHFNLDKWKDSASQCSIGLEDYLRQRELTEILPWQHLQSGISPSFLTDELEKATTQTYTADCRYYGCHKCGLCDFKTIQPIVHSKKKDAEKIQVEGSLLSSKQPTENPQEDVHIKYMVIYARSGKICYLGHLDILQLIFRTLRRAKITTNFSKGFNPSPKISFGPALSVGTESQAEYFIMDLPQPLHDIEETIHLLNENLPPGLVVKEIVPHSGKIPQSILTSYEVTLPRNLLDTEREALAAFQTCTTFPIQRRRKGKVKELDIRPLISTLQILRVDTLQITTVNRSGSPGVKVLEALKHILSLDEETVLIMKIIKTGWIDLKEESPS